MDEWIRTMTDEAKELMENDYYCIDSAMEKVWDRHYCSIVVSGVDVGEVRTKFWEDGFNELEAFNEEIISRYEEEESEY